MQALSATATLPAIAAVMARTRESNCYNYLGHYEIATGNSLTKVGRYV